MVEFVIEKYIEINKGISINISICWSRSSLLQCYNTIEEAMIGSLFIYL